MMCWILVLVTLLALVMWFAWLIWEVHSRPLTNEEAYYGFREGTED